MFKAYCGCLAHLQARQSASGCVGDQDECVRREGEQYGASITPQELRVVCDNMLQGLGRYLRCVGVDVLMLENTDDHRVAAQVRHTHAVCAPEVLAPFE